MLQLFYTSEKGRLLLKKMLVNNKFPYVAVDAITLQIEKPRIQTQQNNGDVAQDASHNNNIIKFRRRHLDYPDKMKIKDVIRQRAPIFNAS